MANASHSSDDLDDTAQTPTDTFTMAIHEAGVTTIEATTDPSGDEDSLTPPTENFALIIYSSNPEALELAKRAGTEFRKTGNDEIVLLPAPRFDRPGLTHLRSFLAGLIEANPAPSVVLAEVHGNLVAGEPRTATIDQLGKVREVDRTRWLARDADEILLTGRMGEDDVYVVTDPIAAGIESPAWWPGKREFLNHWCARKEVEDGARARLKAVGVTTPFINELNAEMLRMWHEAGNETGTLRSIEQYYRTGGRS